MLRVRSRRSAARARSTGPFPRSKRRAAPPHAPPRASRRLHSAPGKAALPGRGPSALARLRFYISEAYVKSPRLPSRFAALRSKGTPFKAPHPPVIFPPPARRRLRLPTLRFSAPSPSSPSYRFALAPTLLSLRCAAVQARSRCASLTQCSGSVSSKLRSGIAHPRSCASCSRLSARVERRTPGRSLPLVASLLVVRSRRAAPPRLDFPPLHFVAALLVPRRRLAHSAVASTRCARSRFASFARPRLPSQTCRASRRCAPLSRLLLFAALRVVSAPLRLPALALPPYQAAALPDSGQSTLRQAHHWVPAFAGMTKALGIPPLRLAALAQGSRVFCITLGVFLDSGVRRHLPYIPETIKPFAPSRSLRLCVNFSALFASASVLSV